MFGWIKRVFAKPEPVTMGQIAPGASGVAASERRIRIRRYLIAQLDEEIAKAVKDKKPRKGLREQKTRILHEIMEIERKMGGELGG